MATSNHQNSIGWLGLQVKQQQRQHDQSVRDKINQERRDDNREAGPQALAILQHQLDAQNASEDRKLKLAELLHKAADTNDTKLRLQELEHQFKLPEQESKVGRNNAQAGLYSAKIQDIPIDNIRADKDLQRKSQQDIDAAEDMIRKHDDRVRGQNLLFGGKLLNRDPFTGKIMAEPVPGGEASSIMRGLGLAPREDAYTDEIDIGIQGRKDAAKKLDEWAQQSRDAAEAVRQVEEADSKFFNPVAGGTDITIPKEIPFFGGKTTHVGGNTWADLEANMDKLPPEQKEAVSKRRGASQAIKRLVQTYRHAMSGAQFSDPESQDYLETITGFKGDPFSSKRELLADALKRTQAHIDRRTALLEHMAKTGKRPAGYGKMTNDELEAYYNKAKASGGSGGDADLDLDTGEITPYTPKTPAEPQDAESYYEAKLKEFGGDEAKAAKATAKKYGPPK